MYFHPEKNKGKRPVCAAQEARVRRKGPLHWEQAVLSVSGGLYWGRHREGSWATATLKRPCPRGQRHPQNKEAGESHQSTEPREPKQSSKSTSCHEAQPMQRWPQGGTPKTLKVGARRVKESLPESQGTDRTLEYLQPRPSLPLYLSCSLQPLP